MTKSLRFVAAAAAIAAAPLFTGAAFAQSIPDASVVTDLIGGSAPLPDVIEAGPITLDIDIPAGNGDPIDITLYLVSPTGGVVELPGDVTIPLAEAIFGTGGGGGVPALPIDPTDLLGGGGLPTDPTALLTLLPLGGAGGLPTDLTALLALLPTGGGLPGLPTDPTALLVLLPTGGAGGLPTDPTALLSLLPINAGGAGLPVDPADLLNTLPIQPLDIVGTLPLDGSLPIDPASLGLPALPNDPTGLLGGVLGDLPVVGGLL